MHIKAAEAHLLEYFDELEKRFNSANTTFEGFSTKIRDKLFVSPQATKEEVEKAALASEKVKPYLTGTPKKVIVVPSKLVNIVM